jgi:hypothetical protein
MLGQRLRAIPRDAGRLPVEECSGDLGRAIRFVHLPPLRKQRGGGQEVITFEFLSRRDRRQLRDAMILQLLFLFRFNNPVWAKGLGLAEVENSQSIRIPISTGDIRAMHSSTAGDVLSATRNVWSAALSQAKSEDDGLVCANVSGL